MCGMSLQADAAKKSEVFVPPPSAQKEPEQKPWMWLDVFVHTRVQVKCPKNGFSAGSVSSRPGSCPLVRLCFLIAALGAQHLSGGALKHNTPNEMWLVSPYCSIYTGWDSVVGEDAKKHSPAAWWGLVALQPQGGGCVIFTLAWKGEKETSPPLKHHTFPPKAKKNSR